MSNLQPSSKRLVSQYISHKEKQQPKKSMFVDPVSPPLKKLFFTAIPSQFYVNNDNKLNLKINIVLTGIKIFKVNRFLNKDPFTLLS